MMALILDVLDVLFRWDVITAGRPTRRRMRRARRVADRRFQIEWND